ncbi:MAG TPA: anti-sigma factor [Actinomycetota bacterium]
MQGDVTITTPASAEYVHILRVVLAGILAANDYTIDQIEDLKIAVSEAAAQLLAMPGGTTLSLGVEESNGDVRLRLTCDAAGQAWPPPDVERTFSWQVLSALADEVHFRRAQGDAVLELTSRRSGGN